MALPDDPVVPVAPSVAPETDVTTFVALDPPSRCQCNSLSHRSSNYDSTHSRIRIRPREGSPADGVRYFTREVGYGLRSHAGRFVGLYRVLVPIGASKPRSATQSTQSRLGPQDD